MKIRLGYKKVIVFSLLASILAISVLPADLIERLYGNGIYTGIRYLFHSISFVPFPVIYILVVVCIYLIWRLFKSADSFKIKGISLIKGLGWGIALFYLLWAFNYKRPAFGSKFPLDRRPLDSTAWLAEIFFAKAKLENARPVNLIKYELPVIEEMVRENVISVAKEFGYEAPGRIRVKMLWPSGILLRIKTAGFYLPYSGEGYLDPGLHHIQHAYTLAHEMCHGYGVTDEGACNFLAYLALANIQDSTLNYSAQMAYFRYVATEYRHRYPRSYKSIRDSLPSKIQQDLDEINASMVRYPDIFPRLRDKIYSNYLQMQGIKDGMASYDNVIGYVRQFRNAGRIK